MILSSHVAVLMRNVYIADDAFTAELLKAHGSKRAGEYRYRRDKDTPRLREMSDAYNEVCQLWHDGLELLRKQDR